MTAVLSNLQAPSQDTGVHVSDSKMEKNCHFALNGCDIGILSFLLQSPGTFCHTLPTLLTLQRILHCLQLAGARGPASWAFPGTLSCCQLSPQCIACTQIIQTKQMMVKRLLLHIRLTAPQQVSLVDSRRTVAHQHKSTVAQQHNFLK